jgi:uncharacterized protein
LYEGSQEEIAVRVEVDKIKNGQDLHLNETIDAASWDLDSFDVHFINGIYLDCMFKRLGREILVSGNVKTTRLITCSRCLVQAKQEKERQFKLSYSVPSLGEHLDIDKDVREEVLLGFPMKVLCKETCKGMCAGCGANLNNEACTCGKPETKESKTEIRNSKQIRNTKL